MIVFFCSLGAKQNALFGQRKLFKHQTDSLDLTFSGTKINPYDVAFDSTGKFELTGYVDAYYAHYSDTVGNSGYSKFPTIAPRNNQFGLNMVQLNGKYVSKDLRGTFTVFAGDCPAAAWSPVYNYIQEANIGFRLYKKLWLDVGYFRTHIGLESIQPRENMTLSLATTSYFEPYFLSGAKLTWQKSEKLTFQLNVFNSFNQFIETNKNKAIGASTSYTPNEKTNVTFSTIVCDETALNENFDMNAVAHRRWYNNLCLTQKSRRWLFGFEMNYGLQTNSNLVDSSRNAVVLSGLLAARYRITPQWSAYARTEAFVDRNEMLTGPVMNDSHTIVGPEILGFTHGYEYKPIPNSFVRVEMRVLSNRDGQIFSLQGAPSALRYEILTGIGVWF